MKRPKFHFLTVIQNGSGRSLVPLPGQTFGRTGVMSGVLVKDVKGKTIVARARKSCAVGDILYTTTLGFTTNSYIARDLYRLDDTSNIFIAEAREQYEKLTQKN